MVDELQTPLGQRPPTRQRGRVPVDREDGLVQGLDLSTIIWAGMMMLLLLAFILFTLWQRLEKPENEGLDLETYRKIKERHERLARASRERKRPLGTEAEEGPGSNPRSE